MQTGPAAPDGGLPEVDPAFLIYAQIIMYLVQDSSEVFVLLNESTSDTPTCRDLDPKYLLSYSYCLDQSLAPTASPHMSIQ